MHYGFCSFSFCFVVLTWNSWHSWLIRCVSLPNDGENCVPFLKGQSRCTFQNLFGHSCVSWGDHSVLMALNKSWNAWIAGACENDAGMLQSQIDCESHFDMWHCPRKSCAICDIDQCNSLRFQPNESKNHAAFLHGPMKTHLPKSVCSFMCESKWPLCAQASQRMTECMDPWCMWKWSWGIASPNQLCPFCVLDVKQNSTTVSHSCPLPGSQSEHTSST